VDLTLGAVLLFQDDVRFRESPLDVTARVALRSAGVALVAHLRGVRLQRPPLVRNERPHVVLDLDRAQRVPRLVRRLSRHGGDRFALIPTLGIEQLRTNQVHM